jgi:AmpD protein
MNVDHLPHHCHPNKRLKSVDGAVIHFISDRFRHPKDPFNYNFIRNILIEYGASYHVFIPREGDPVELLPLHLEAWHAGHSRMNGRDWCNSFTHGYSLEGMPGVPYTDSQMIHLGQFLATDMSTNLYTTDWIKGHDEVRQAWNNAHPDRKDHPKHDPGPLFDWDALRDMLAGVDLAIRVKRRGLSYEF